MNNKITILVTFAFQRARVPLNFQLQWVKSFRTLAQSQSLIMLVASFTREIFKDIIFLCLLKQYTSVCSIIPICVGRKFVYPTTLVIVLFRTIEKRASSPTHSLTCDSFVVRYLVKRENHSETFFFPRCDVDDFLWLSEFLTKWLHCLETV